MERYIDKDALVAEIERQLSAIDNCPKLTDTQIAVLEGNKVVLTKLLSFIGTLEVKEAQEESVSEGLEEAAEDYCKSTLVGSPYVKKNAFKEGAKWANARLKEEPINRTPADMN